MESRLQIQSQRLTVRRCLDCGYDGALLRAGQAPQCPRCGCDLIKRPARSYAEMEGLVDDSETTMASLNFAPATCAPSDSAMPQDRLVHRWLVVLFMLLMGLIAIAYLTAAAFAV